uniref:Bromo domain-containing protein n=1 Tax=Timema cristinae TaxID=61476 RepID=A0A7R9CZ21_TIMCR|nr:unnamed protein product [Timema cristinae]
MGHPGINNFKTIASQGLLPGLKVNNIVKLFCESKTHLLPFYENLSPRESKPGELIHTDIPDYYRIVKHPMDLSDIARKLRNIIYETIEQFVHDFRLIFYNIRLYNEKGSVYYKKGATLSQRFDELLEDNFPGWVFKSITGSPRELNTNPTLRYRAFDDHRKSTAKHLSQHNSQASSQPHLTTKFILVIILEYTRLLALIVPTPMTVFTAYDKDAVPLLYGNDAVFMAENENNIKAHVVSLRTTGSQPFRSSIPRPHSLLCCCSPHHDLDWFTISPGSSFLLETLRDSWTCALEMTDASPSSNSNVGYLLEEDRHGDYEFIHRPWTTTPRTQLRRPLIHHGAQGKFSTEHTLANLIRNWKSTFIICISHPSLCSPKVIQGTPTPIFIRGYIIILQQSADVPDSKQRVIQFPTKEHRSG